MAPAECTLGPVAVRVLSWNLKHGRAMPSAGHDLFEEFVVALAGWAWDVALLQEVPPWWPPRLADRLGAEQRCVLTSRNALLPLRRVVAERRPDLIKSNGGGSNAILVRGMGVVAHRTQLLGRLPERRRVHGVRLATGMWVANLHAQARIEQARLAADTVVGWAAGAPAVLGGDFNLRGLALEGFARAAAHDVDYVFCAGLVPEGACAVLERGRLSDHAPVVVAVELS